MKRSKKGEAQLPAVGGRTGGERSFFLTRSPLVRRRVSRILGFVTGGVGILLFVLTMLQVIARLFGYDIDWVWESLRILLIWSLTSGAFAASLCDGHFRVNLGKGPPTNVDNPNRAELFRQLLIVSCLGFLFLVSLPTIPKTKVHKLATLPFDERIFRIGFLGAIGGMLLAHLWSLVEIGMRVFTASGGKKTATPVGE
jgi:TRAP-type C4-dicarboxylate transport system permease small subunit